MQIKVKRTMGDAVAEIEVEGKDIKEAMLMATVFTQQDYCSLCNNAKIYWNSNKDKEGNIYIKRRCSKCGAESKLGNYKTGGYFWHKFEIWEGGKDKINTDDIPY